MRRSVLAAASSNSIANTVQCYGEAIPLGGIARQAQPNPARTLRKNARPDPAMGQLLLRCARVGRIVKAEQCAAADQAPGRMSGQRIDLSGLDLQPGRRRL